MKVNRRSEVPLLGQLGTLDMYRGIWVSLVRNSYPDLTDEEYQ